MIGRVMSLYRQAFGSNYPLGILIPEYFEDQSYKNDTGPSFTYTRGNKHLKICILPEDPQLREIDGLRYTLMELRTEPDDDYQEFVCIRFETENPQDFERIIFDSKQLSSWLCS